MSTNHSLSEIAEYIRVSLPPKLNNARLPKGGDIEFVDHLRQLAVCVVPLELKPPYPLGRVLRKMTPSRSSITAIPRDELNGMLDEIAATANAIVWDQ